MSISDSLDVRPQTRGVVPKRLRDLTAQPLVFLTVLLVATLVALFVMSLSPRFGNLLTPQYLADSMINLIPLALLGLGQMFAIASGQGGIDLSVGAVVSLTGMFFGFVHGLWGVPLWMALVLALAFAAFLGFINAVLVVRVKVPALIATLATLYIYGALAIVVYNGMPVSTEQITSLYRVVRSVELPLVGHLVPALPLGLFIFLAPAILIIWFLINRTGFGRRLVAIGTNDTAAMWAGVRTGRTRMQCFTMAGVMGGLVGIVTVMQFASARPDAGASGVGMTLPAITIAVLGGIAITGGVARISGVFMAALLITLVNAALLVLFPGTLGVQLQLVALGGILIISALVDEFLGKQRWRAALRAIRGGRRSV